MVTYHEPRESTTNVPTAQFPATIGATSPQWLVGRRSLCNKRHTGRHRSDNANPSPTRNPIQQAISCARQLRYMSSALCRPVVSNSVFVQELFQGTYV